MKQGLFYFLSCQTCNQEKTKHVCKVIAKTLYATDLSEIKTEKIQYADADGHMYILISVPVGDAEMFRFLGYCCGAEFSFEVPAGILKGRVHTPNIQVLLFPDHQLHPIDVSLGFYLKKDYTNFSTYLSQFNYSDAFCMFMSIRMRIAQKSNDPDLEADINKYYDFHCKNNGKSSQQAAIGFLLFAEWRLQKKTFTKRDNIKLIFGARDRLESPSLKGYAQQLLGLCCVGDAEKQFLLFTQVDAPRFSNMVAFYRARKDYGRASFFAIQASQKFPTLENAKAFAYVFCKLDDRWRARVILREFLSLEDVKKYVLRRDETSLERICQACSKTGHVKTFLRCPRCDRTWYCSQKCLKTDEERHAVMHCRFCYSCETWIPKGKRRQYCSGCYGYFYCGAACQLKHWTIGEHKDKCHKKKDF
jgi:hypothetical protein